MSITPCSVLTMECLPAHLDSLATVRTRMNASIEEAIPDTTQNHDSTQNDHVARSDVVPKPRGLLVASLQDWW